MRQKINIYNMVVVLVTLLMLFSLVGCEKVTVVKSGKEYADGVTEMTIMLEMPSKESSPSAATRAPVGAVDENNIRDLCVLVFKKNGSEEVFYYKKDAYDIINIAGDGNTKLFKVNLRWIMSESEEHTLVFIGNAKGIIPEDVSEGMSKQDLFKLLKFNSTSQWNVLSAPIPMWGEITGVKIEKTTAQDALPPIKMLRAMAKINVGVNYNGDTPQGLGNKFKLESVSVYNSRNKGYVTPHSGAAFDGVKVNASSVPTDAGLNSPIHYYNSANAAKTEIMNQVYITESDNIVDNVTTLVIGGRYSEVPATEGLVTSYYKVVLKKADVPVAVLRNYLYKINIVDVLGHGWSTPDEAYNARKEDLTVEISAWDEGMIETIKDNQYVLKSPSIVNINNEAANIRFEVFTNHESGWKLKAKESYNWLTVVDSESSVSGYWDAVEIKVTQNGTGFNRVAEIYLTAGRMSKLIKIHQGSSMNIQNNNWGMESLDATVKDVYLYVSTNEVHINRGVPYSTENMNGVYNTPYMGGAIYAVTLGKDFLQTQTNIWLIAYSDATTYGEFKVYKMYIRAHALDDYSISASREGECVIKVLPIS